MGIMMYWHENPTAGANGFFRISFTISRLSEQPKPKFRMIKKKIVP